MTNLPRRVVLLTLPAMLVACGALDGPRSVSLSEAELQRRIELAFPLERRVLELLELTLSAPQLRLIPERNRLAAELDIGARDRLRGGQWSGRLAFESALRYDATEQSLRLAQVRVTQLTLGSGGASQAQAERIGAVLAERVLEGFTVYRLPADKAATLQRAGMVPGEVAVNARGVEITLVPAPR